MTGDPVRHGLRIQAAFDAIAEEFDASRRRPWGEVVEFTEGLPPGSRLLDVGCGNGRHMMPHLRRGGTAVGLDLSSRMLAAARSNLGGEGPWSLALGVAARLPFPRNAFDAVLCTATVHHIPSAADRLAAVEEVRRVLVPGGAALLSCWAFEQDRFSQLDSQDAEVHWTLADGSRVMRFYHLFREGELAELAGGAGLTVDRSFRAGGNYYVEASKRG